MPQRYSSLVAAAGTRTIIELVGGGQIETRERSKELKRRMSRDTKFVKVEDVGGLQHWVNPAQVTEFYEPPQSAGSA